MKPRFHRWDAFPDDERERESHSIADVRFTDREFDDAGPDDRPTLTASLVFAASVFGIVAVFVYDYAVDSKVVEDVE